MLLKSKWCHMKLIQYYVTRIIFSVAISRVEGMNTSNWNANIVFRQLISLVLRNAIVKHFETRFKSKWIQFDFSQIRSRNYCQGYMLIVSCSKCKNNIQGSIDRRHRVKRWKDLWRTEVDKGKNVQINKAIFLENSLMIHVKSWNKRSDLMQHKT